MTYLLWWLFIGHLLYSLAITIKVYELAYKAGVFKTKMKRYGFLIGLLGIILGPAALLLIDWNREHIKNE